MHDYLQGKTVVVTGAAGFLGSHLCDRLIENGSEVIGIDNFVTGRKKNLAHLEGNESFRFIEANVNVDPELYMADVVPDVILHFASPASPPSYQKHPIETYLVNAYATHLLLSFLKSKNPNARFLFAGTSEAYGDPSVHPQPESYWGNVNPNGIRSCYDESKRMGETVCGVFHREFGMDTRIVRIFNTYGPRMNPEDGRVIPNLAMQALRGEALTIYGDGTQTRSYCYVDDLIAGILTFLVHPELAGETLNIGNPEEFSILETADAIQDIVGETERTFEDLPGDDPTKRQPDISKALSLLDWKPSVTFTEGLVKTIEYFKTELFV
ncbi:NAD-dependent epimerase/dehydratase family protein [Candidatus Woesebacteria bacterium]|nr:NAD-dependent epimerase/dehydratase family protein [Candidatus Woesebacteria bacterium]